MNSIIDLERPIKNFKNGEHIVLAIKCHKTPGDMESGTYEINLPHYEGEHLKSGFYGRINSFKHSKDKGLSLIQIITILPKGS